MTTKDWSEIIDRYSFYDAYNIEFLRKYEDYIPVSALQKSYLWGKLVEAETKRLKMQILY